MMRKGPWARPADKTDAAFNQQGAALLGAVLTVLIMSMVGMVSVNLAVEEVTHTNMAKDAATARRLAEAGADMVIQWFHDQTAVPQGAVRQLLAQRFDLPAGPSLFDALGRSQFAGTKEHPDILLDASRPADERFLDDASRGLFRGLAALGRVQSMKVYGPSRPGLLCTVEVSVSAGAMSKSFSVQLGANTVPSLPSGIQVGVKEAMRLSDPPLLPWIHWSDLRVKGDLPLPSVHLIPVKTSGAPLSGESYAGMTHPEDQWLEIKVGGDAVLPGPAEGQSQRPMPANVHAGQDPVPGLQVDQWKYDVLKKQALSHGRYYAMDPAGRLYLDGKIAAGLGQRPEEVFGPVNGSPERNLVFVDTLDQHPPGPDNLGTLSIEADYLDGTVIVNAHLHFRPKGDGRTVSALSPPAQPAGSDLREPVSLPGIHINGAVYVAGNLLYEGSPRIYGAIIVGGRIVPDSSAAGPLELWYNHDLSLGLVKGLPVVITAGTMQENF